MRSLSKSDLDSIQNAFVDQGLEIVFEDAYSLVLNSNQFTDQKIREVVESTGFAPLISDNRLNGNVAFTVTPFSPPDFFYRSEFKALPCTSQEELWEAIREETKEWTGKMKVVEGGLVFTDPVAYWSWFLDEYEFSVPHELVEFIRRKESPKKGIALDIGFGSGEETMYLLEKGWRVLAVDKTPRALELLTSSVIQRGVNWLRNNQLKLERKAIEEFSFPEGMDLVLAFNVIPYTNPHHIQDIWKKIYESLKKEGYFLGNTFIGVSDQSEMAKLLSLGGWCLNDANTIYTLLLATGYEIVEFRHRWLNAKKTPNSVEFIVKKV